MSSNASWYSIQARAQQDATIRIFGEIGSGGITAAQFIDDLRARGDVKRITLEINSIGGDVADGVAIFNAIQRHPANVTGEIVGWALSIASYIAMACDRLTMAENALMMIHAPWTPSARGNANELRKAADMLETAKESIIGAYATRSNKTRTEIDTLLQAETWFTAADALAAGFIDEIIPAIAMAAQLDSPFQIPAHLNKGIITMTATTAPTTSNPKVIDAATESARRASIRASFAPFSDRGQDVATLMDTCLDDFSITADAAGQKLLAALATGSGPLGGGLAYDANVYTGGRFGGDRMTEFKAACGDALLMRGGVSVKEPNPQVADVRRLRVVDMAAAVLSMQGRSTMGMAPDAIIKAAHSTSDFPSLLANTAGKALRIGYEEAPGTHAIWTAEVEVPDFKPQTLAALSEAPELQEVVEGAEYKYGTFGEAAETFAVKTYGRIFSITRQAIINDDLLAFTRMPQAFGSAARRLESDLVYSKLTANPAMADGFALFHANHSNLLSAAALSLAELGKARAAMRKQKGPSGLGFIDPVPRFLIVPVTLETTAEQLVSSLVMPAAAADANINWIRNLVVVADPRLDAASATAWYLAADPRQIETIVRAYLMGEARPYFEENTEFVKDVLGVKSRLDVGVGVIDFRGLVKNPGA